MLSTDTSERSVLVLLVDDDIAYLEVLKFFLERESAIECEMATSAKEALDLLSGKNYDAIVSDYLMPEMDGLELLKIVRLQGKDTPFIMLTGRGREDVAIQAINNGADFYIQKGGDPKAQYTDLANMIRKSTKERRAVSSARESERFLRRLFESVQDGVSVLNREMVIERVNPAMERWYSDSMPLVGKKCHEAYHHSSSPCEVCPVRETLRSARVHRERIKTDIVGEGPKWLDVYSYPVVDDQTGEVDGVIEYLRDVSEEEATRQAFEASERTRRAITDLAGEGMLAIEAGGRITFANPRMAALLGYSVEDIIGMQIGSLVDRKWLESVGPGRLHKLLEEGDRVELMMTRKDGSAVKVIVAASPTSRERGMFEGAVATVIDVSDLRTVIEGMASQEGRSPRVFQTSSQMIMVARASDSVILDANEPFLNATGYTSDQLVGKSYIALGLVPRDLSLKIESEIGERGMISDLEATLTTSSGDDRAVRLSCYKLDLQGQECIIFLSCDRPADVAIDVTEQRRYERALKEANEKLNLLGEITQHDIMNQLSILTSWLLVLREEEADPDRIKRLDALSDSADIIRELLEFESEYQDMGAQNPVWVDLESAFREGIQGLPLQEVAVEVDVPSVEVYADPMFSRVFRNLVDNSLRHGEEVSRVKLSVRPEGRGQVIVYEDDGSGIPDAVREHMFERGFGMHTGMGLFMVREILGLTDMTIRETGREGSGARFEITVPEGSARVQTGKD